jgi:endoglucanase
MYQKKLQQWVLLTGTILCSFLWLTSRAYAASPMQSYVDAMQPGINLGNTLDAIPDETSWGNPLVTQALLQQFAAQGYKSIRIPITWTAHTGPAPTYTVNPAWMDRVQQVVDWAQQAGLYVMINMHHDSWQWVSSMPTNHDAVIAQYSAVWTQVSSRFRNYSNMLMFESINEPQFKNVDDATAMTLLNELNTTFFDIVRGSGGLNATRPLVLTVLGGGATQPHLDSLAATIANLNDPNLITTFHYYSYWPFSVNIVGYTAFDSTVISDLTTDFDGVYNTFVAKGIPAVVGEFGVLNGNAIERGEFLKYHEYVTHYARSERMTGMYWDTGGLINRNTYQRGDPDLEAIMMQTVRGRATTSDTDLIFVTSGAPVRDAVVNLNLNGNNVVSLNDGSTTLQRGKDYTIEDSVLTVKASELSRYASGSFGEQTVLAVNLNSGPAWKIHVRYVSPPVPSPVSGTTGGALVIPTALNGDLLATMEARHADGSSAGANNWTAFKAWGDFLPDYKNNTITVSSNFFTGEPAGTINLTFHFWSGRIATYQLSLQTRVSGGSDLSIYDNSLASGWQNLSWATVNLANTTTANSPPDSISVDAGVWGALYLAYAGAAMDTSIYHSLTFWANGGLSGGQQITIYATVNSNGNGLPSYTINSLPANSWQQFKIPLAALGVDGQSNITSFGFINSSGTTEPTFYIDDIHLSPAYASTDLRVTGAPTSATPSTASFEIDPKSIKKANGTNLLAQKVNVTNTGSQPITGPIYLVLDGMSTNTTLMNATGVTSNVVPGGTPYITVTTTGLAPGKTASVTLEFSIPTSRGGNRSDDSTGSDDYEITYTPSVLGNGAVP